jgi:DNA-binding NarL/FixJ family response regulator
MLQNAHSPLRMPMTKSVLRSKPRSRERLRVEGSPKPARGDRAIAELQRAAAALDACGALHYRRSAERELRRLGHRPHRRTRPGRTDRLGIESLTERELQVARLVVDRKTNPEIAAELFLSQKTVETHLGNIFNKMGVSTRVALARAVERADQPTGAGPRDAG